MKPFLNEIPSRTVVQQVFGGLQEKALISDNEFKAMKNMSSDYYPVLAPRKKRKLQRQSEDLAVVLVGKDVYSIRQTGTGYYSYELYKNGEKFTYNDNPVVFHSVQQFSLMGDNIICTPGNKIISKNEKGQIEISDMDINISSQANADKPSRYTFDLYNNYVYMSTADGNPLLECSSEIEYDADNAEGTRVPDKINSAGVIISGLYAVPVSGTETGVKNYAVQGRSNPYGEPKYISWDETSKVAMIEKYYKTSGAFTAEESYCSIKLTLTSAEVASLKKELKAGDYVTLALVNPGGYEERTEDIKNTRDKELWSALEGTRKLEKVQFSEIPSDYSIVMTFAGINLFDFMKKYDYAILSDNSGTGEAKRLYTYVITRPTIKLLTSGERTIRIKRLMPQMDYVTVSNNRLWGCSSIHHEIYASVLGDPKRWQQFEGISTDAYAVTIGSQGSFTGAFTLNGMPYFTKEDLIIGMYGNKPANYQTQEFNVPGVEEGSYRSCVYSNGYMYYLARDGIRRFNGSSSTLISSNINDKLKNGIAASAGNKIYMAVEDDKGRRLLVYDQEKGMWHQEDDIKVDQMIKLGSTLLATNEEGYICLYDADDRTDYITLAEEEQEFEWSAETLDLLTEINDKYLSKLSMRIEIKAGARFKVEAEYDSNGKWETIADYTSQGNFSQTIHMIPKRCDHLRLRLSGKGDVKVYNITKYISEGSEVRHGNI